MENFKKNHPKPARSLSICRSFSLILIIMIIIIIITLEMWVGNRGMKDEEKTVKYGPLRWELKQQYFGYSLEQYNIIMDVPGGWSTEMEASLTKLLGAKFAEVLRKMQKSVTNSSLHIARIFKVAI